MNLLCIEGPVPGVISASIAHEGSVRRIALELGRHDAGGWHARIPGGLWGLRCNAAHTAILLEAAELFAGAAPVPQDQGRVNCTVGNRSGLALSASSWEGAVAARAPGPAASVLAHIAAGAVSASDNHLVRREAA